MAANAEKSVAEKPDKVYVKAALENYADNISNSVRDDEIFSKLDLMNKKKIEDAIEDTFSWLDVNQLAEVDELENKMFELEAICMPIIAKVFEGAKNGSGVDEDGPMGGRSGCGARSKM